MIKLIKASAPGWEKEFNTLEELKLELYNQICSSCKCGELQYVGIDECEYTNPVTLDSSIGEMLSTACGCEFDVGGVSYDD